MLDQILKFFDQKLVREIQRYGSNERLTEIRMRAGKYCILRFGIKEIKTNILISKQEILNILVAISKNSIYSIQNDINNGFLTIPGGHRVGVCGEVVIENGSIKNIKNIASINIRVAREIKGVSRKIVDYVISNDEIKNTLIVSPPGCGKTTLLRDLVRILSGEYDKTNGKNIGLIDERSEIAAVYNGEAQLDVGDRTDIITGCSKSMATSILIRSMSPDIIVADEIGKKEDLEAAKYAAISGTSFIFTMHGQNIRDIMKNSDIKEMLVEGLFDTIVILSGRNGPGTIEKVYENMSVKYKECI